MSREVTKEIMRPAHGQQNTPSPIRTRTLPKLEWAALPRRDAGCSQGHPFQHPPRTAHQALRCEDCRQSRQ